MHVKLLVENVKFTPKQSRKIPTFYVSCFSNLGTCNKQMKKYFSMFLVLIAASPGIVQGQKVQTEHFTSKYQLEAKAYASASLEVLEAAWSIAVRNGYSLPEQLKFTMKKADRNALYFNRKNLKEIVWEYENLSEMLPPDKSKKNNIYGLCHELGHLCMYTTNHNRNSWMSYNYREAWAVYFGNMIIDSLYEEYGMDIWPAPHDYKKYAGMKYFLGRIENNNPELQGFNNAGLFWYELGSELGFSNIPKFFNSLKEEKVDNPGAKEKFAKILEGYMAKQDNQNWFDQYSGDLIITIE